MSATEDEITLAPNREGCSHATEENARRCGLDKAAHESFADPNEPLGTIDHAFMPYPEMAFCLLTFQTGANLFHKLEPEDAERILRQWKKAKEGGIETLLSYRVIGDREETHIPTDLLLNIRRFDAAKGREMLDAAAAADARAQLLAGNRGRG